mmetsp:Transcript_74384/g.210479  ORF Transcript_74384/g.210479 Transcript_74384/m.210479 type:complete len:152 (-) Transcript_74384:92-547(-)
MLRDLLFFTVLLAAFRIGKPEETSCDGGDDAASCRCLLGCDVFGADPSPCSTASDVNVLVNRVIGGVIERRKPGSHCTSMGCVVRCGKRLGCLSTALRDKCENLKSEHGDCYIDCNGSRRTTGAGTAPRLAAALALVAAMAWTGPCGHRPR